MEFIQFALFIPARPIKSIKRKTSQHTVNIFVYEIPTSIVCVLRRQMSPSPIILFLGVWN